MHLISRKMLKEFWATHPDAENPLKAWAKEVERAQWANSAALNHVWEREHPGRQAGGL